ncbi:MAG: hypothetical protein UT36_C0008G0016 [Candidatus Peregrinibacteria bacterium GW2011_GWF2_39_17]|nr:MAG: hypothetical protein UT36_C0008G0016 [Candidatus Peregrinibacteria bacterium GW2011_GWF2_39_17]HCW32054.1 hypothetical protein [Candidatus Peregrinibacteria bacterium]
MINNDSTQELALFFAELAPDEHEKLLTGSGIWQKKYFPLGVTVFAENSTSTDLYLILKGQIEISKIVGEKGTKKKILAILGQGSIFGEGALLSDKPRSATATTLVNTETLVLSKEKFESFLKERPKEANYLLLALLRVVNQRLIWTNHELVTLYEIAQIISKTKNDLPALVKKIMQRLASLTKANRGLIALKNRSTQKQEISTQWGNYNLSSEELDQLAQKLITQHTLHEKTFLALPLYDFSENFLGIIAMESQVGWTIETRKIARAVTDQLGIAISDYWFMESENGRSKLEQRNVEF